MIKIVNDTPYSLEGTPATSAHTFHIPVMGTGFTIDTALRVARYGIASVVPLVDDVLIEQMRRYYCESEGEEYRPIDSSLDDARALRITAYLNLIDRLVARQVRALQAAPFEPGSDITRYFELLPDTPLKNAYRAMLACDDPAQKSRLQESLRRQAVPGSIDVNIMTKLDRPSYAGGCKRPPEYNDAMAALRGFARSTLRSSIVFSAGLSQHLYSYAAHFDDFFPDATGCMKKSITLKVSDYRSALVQGKFLAKRGLWVSEYRVESGLNCGGHAFPSKGYLLGPILDEFRQKQDELVEMVFGIYSKGLEALGRQPVEKPHDMRLTVQGGIGTADEHNLCLQYYKVDRTGWATPFLLVPEVTNLDDEHLRKLMQATEKDVFLSESSTLSVPFWNLRNSASEEVRRARVLAGKPGAPCVKGYTRMNFEFTDPPICIASRAYQERKLQQLDADDRLNAVQREKLREGVLAKSCICHDLAGGVTLKHGIDPKATPAVCSGPNIVNFSKIASLEEMVGHIYGRLSLLTNSNRPHMFISELMINVEHLRKEVEKFSIELSERTPKYFHEFKENLLSGIEHYQDLADQFIEEQKTRFLGDLNALKEEIESIPLLNLTSCRTS